MNETSNLTPHIQKEDFHCVADILSCGLIKLSIPRGEILYANDTFFQLNNCTKEKYKELYQNNLFHQMTLDEAESIKETIIPNSNSLSFYYEYIDEKNTSKHFYLEGKLVNDSTNKKKNIFLCTIEDITNEKIFEQPQFFERFRSEILTKLYGKIFWEYNILNKTLYRYGELDDTYSQDNMIPDFLNNMIEHNYVHKDDEEAFLHFFESLTKGHSFRASVIRLKDYLDCYHWYRIQGSVLFDKNNIPVRIFGTTLNVGKQEKSTVSQTELMKKSEFVKSINEYFKLHHTNPLQHSFVLIEIDNYKSLRRIYGKTLLENIITEAIIELKDTFSNHLLGQLTPSTFGVFYEELFQKSDLILQVQKYQDIVKELYNNPETFSITCSAGIIIENKVSSYNMLYKKALIALSTAQKKGGGFFDFYGHSKAQQVKPPKISVLENTIKSSPTLSFVQKTIDLLNADNIEDALSHYLSHLCQYFKGSHAYIVLKNQVSQTFSSAYQYHIPACTEDIHMLYQYSFELMGNYETFFADNHCFICNTLDEIEQVSPVLADSYRLANVDSFIQYGIYEKNNWIGYIGIDKCYSNESIDSINSLSDTDMAVFYFVGKFINYIIKNLQRKLCMAFPYNRDKLTGLLTFHEFITQGDHILRANTDKKFAVISCDINHFRKYNKNFGITVGNKTLKNYADSLLFSLRENELCTRISDDHFAVLLNYQSEDELFSRLIIRSNNSLYNVKQSPDYFRFDVVYGLYMIEENIQLSEALKKAITARKSLKGYSGIRYAIYNKDIQKKEQETSLLKNKIEYGLNNHEFIPYYQPKYSLVSNELVGFEALVRWQQSAEIIRSPEYFLSALKEDYSIIELDFQIIQCVCKDMRAALKQAQKIYPVSINLSISHLMTTNFIERLLSLIRYYEIPCSYLGFEISEKYYIYFNKEISSLISELKELGFSIIIDDFGSQYSSLNIIRDLDIDAIKVNTTIANPNNLESKENIILKSLIHTAKELDISIYAHKVETKEQAEYFTNLGCETGQGFYYSRPIPFHEINSL